MTATSTGASPWADHPPVWNRFSPDDALPEGLPFNARSALYRYAQLPPFAAAIPYTAALTAMHPGIASAVDQHSSFRREPFLRAFLTLDAGTQLASNRVDEVIAMAEHVRRYHTTVHGAYEPADGPPYAGSSYAANDTRLQTWVIWCVQRGVEQSYERWMHPMSWAEREWLYADVRSFGIAFGIPDAMLPSKRRELDAYADDLIGSGVIGGTPTSRRLTREVMQVSFPHGRALTPAAALVRAISMTFLDDPRLQEIFDLRPTPADRRVATAFDLAMRSSWRHLPEAVRLRAFPTYLATRRLLVPLFGNRLKHSR
jgi:uncharacterized protein (DUF2236 family)